MKLIYLFIDDFAPFKKTEMNFVADFRCSFVNGKLSVVRHQVLPDKFFSKGNTAELFVSAIVGPNGSGKTSLIRFLEAVHYFPTRANKFVMLIEAKGKLCVYYNLGGGPLQVEARDCEIARNKVIDILGNKDADNYDDLNTYFHTIYYSPYYIHTSPVNYPSPNDESDAYFTSISTTTKLNEASQRLTGLSLSPDVIYRAEEIKREIRFYREAAIDLPHPESILLRSQDWRLQEIAGMFLRLIQDEKGKRERIALGESKPELRLNDDELGRLVQMYAFLVRPSQDAFIEMFKCMAAIAWYKNSAYRDANFEKKLTASEPLKLYGHTFDLRRDDNEFGRRLYELVTKKDVRNELVPLTRKAIVKELRDVECRGVFDFNLHLTKGIRQRDKIVSTATACSDFWKWVYEQFLDTKILIASPTTLLVFAKGYLEKYSVLAGKARARPTKTQNAVVKVIQTLFDYDAFRAGKVLAPCDTKGTVRWIKLPSQEPKSRKEKYRANKKIVDAWDGWSLAEYVRLLDIRYCPYCNAETVGLVQRTNPKAKTPVAYSALDHILPKSKHPLLALRSITSFLPARNVTRS